MSNNKSQTFRTCTNYRIIVEGIIDASWSDWLGGLELSAQKEADGTMITIMSGELIDQAALRGLLNRLWDLNLVVRSIQEINPEQIKPTNKEAIMHAVQNVQPNQPLALQIRGLTKSYGKVRALRGIDLEVRQGEIFGFLGPNGAGKTTTIRCLMDSIRPDGGTVRILGLDPQAQPVDVQTRTGYLPGEMQFFDNFTVEHQLRFFSDMRNGRTEWKVVRQLAERLNLDLKPQIKNLSKGNKQKIGVIQALMHHPELLILDEPTSGLDPLIQQEVLSLLREANAAGSTVFFSSHIMSEVESVAERVAIIRLGQIVEIAQTSTLTHRTINRLTIRFKQAVNPEAFGDLPGVEILDCTDQTAIALQVTGDMEQLMHLVGRLPVLDLETQRPSLEEVFLTYYKE